MTAFRALVLGALALCGAESASAQPGSVVVAKTTLSVPSDSHEPQRALVDLHNDGPDPVASVTVSCAFTGEGGAVLEAVTLSVGAIGGQAAAKATATYYGWPRAARVSCRPVEPRG